MMTKWDKLLSKILSLDNSIRFAELRKVLESYGYMMHISGRGGSHFTFRKPGRSPITIPKHKPIKKKYVEMVRDIVEEEMDHEDS